MKFSRRVSESTSSFGRSITGGHGPINSFHSRRISVRRRGQAAADFTGVPSLKRSGERYAPNWPANSDGGWKNGAMISHGRDLTPSLPPSEGERVPAGRVSGDSTNGFTPKLSNGFTDALTSS